jgi:hypothetical protein
MFGNFENLFGGGQAPTGETAEDMELNKGRSEGEINDVLEEEGVKDESEDQNDDTPMAA